MGALQLWAQFRKDPQRALENYRRGLEMGGARPLPELFGAAGIPFDFSAVPHQAVAQALPIVVAVVLIGLAIGLIIGTIVHFVRLVVALAR